MGQKTGDFPILTARGVDLNSTGDLASWTALPNNFIVDKIEIFNWSATPSALLSKTLRDAASGGGNSLVGVLASLNAIIASTSLAAVGAPSASVLGATRVVSTNVLYFNVSVANGTALTADINVYFHVP